MKTVYICGDSFAVADPEYFDHWVERLSCMLTNQFKIRNLSKVSASNLHIALQVENALQNHADFIVYLATSSLRIDMLISQPKSAQTLLDRYIDLTDDTSNGDLISVSFSYINNNTRLFNQQSEFVKTLYTDYLDIDVEVYKNKLMIEAVLAKLKSSSVPFVFDQGGFEHKKFAGSGDNYFAQYREFFSEINLWDLVSMPMPLRPYFHIKNPDQHQLVADYYAQKILERFQKI